MRVSSLISCNFCSLNLVYASVEFRVFFLRVRGVILLVDALLCFGYMISEK